MSDARWQARDDSRYPQPLWAQALPCRATPHTGENRPAPRGCRRPAMLPEVGAAHGPGRLSRRPGTEGDPRRPRQRKPPLQFLGPARPAAPEAKSASLRLGRGAGADLAATFSDGFGMRSEPVGVRRRFEPVGVRLGRGAGADMAATFGDGFGTRSELVGLRRGASADMAFTFGHGCGIRSVASAPQLSWRPSRRCASGLLPALGGSARPPLSFEDMYASAKRRTAKRSADLRKGGQLPSPSSQVMSPTPSPIALQDLHGAPHGGGGVEGGSVQIGLVDPVLQPSLGLEAPEAAADTVADQGPHAEWIASVMSPDAAPPQVVQVAFEGDAAPEQKVDHRKVNTKKQPALGSAAAAPDASGGPHEPCRSSKSRQVSKNPGEAKQESTASQPDLASQHRGSVESASPSCGGAADIDELSEPGLDVWKAAFNRFKAPGELEAHVDQLGELLCFLGHGLTLPEHYRPLLSDVTNYHRFDFEEFCIFMRKYQKWERHKMREIFQEFDTDDSGEISIHELRPLMVSLGLVPFTATIREALMEVDDGNAQLGFEELSHFLAVYSAKQGFSSAEAKELRMHFDRFAGLDPNLDGAEALDPSAIKPAGSTASGAGVGSGTRAASPSNRLRRATHKANEPTAMEDVLALPYVETVLTLCCGHQQAQFAKGVVEKFLHTQVGQTASTNVVDGLTFEEFLIVARMIRECQREQLKKDNPDMMERLAGAVEDQTRHSTVMSPTVSRATTIMSAVTSEKLATSGLFKVADEDGNGSVSISELKGLLKKQGYTALKQVIAEICTELVEDWHIDYELDFNELFDFLMIFHQREGFLKAEVEAFKRVFFDHDEDNSGEVGTSELSKLLRYLGYRHTASDVQSYIIAADLNQSGQLDWREFLHLMRRFKEAACAEAQRVFEDHASWVRLAPGRGVERVIDQRDLSSALEELGYDPAAADKTLLGAFSMLRLDDFIGVLDATRVDFVERERGKASFTEDELLYFHGIFNEHDKSKTGVVDVLEMEAILNKFGWGPTDKQEQMSLVAKMQTARERARDAGMPGAVGSESGTSFWVFVQLLRLLNDEQDRREDAQLRALRAELGFSEVEVDQFHQVFRHYAKPNPKFVSGLQRGVAPYLLPGDGARKLIRYLGVPVGEREPALEEKLASLDKKGQKGFPVLEFWPFLRLMRWLLDTNYKGINDSVAKLARLKGLPADADVIVGAPP
ncbi:unnamed protein product [Prorocentrum cordatum]|uniref:Calmodulin n=1 Tax=Prorocentrum cordatum TaxID=2364126 RepID=A0ABN9UN20_9DINO|nr:unnamed protein product [Polarella glacialis]